MTPPRILLTTPDPAYEQRIRRAFGGTLNGELRWLQEARTSETVFEEAVGSEADVLALGPDVPIAAALSIARALEVHRPDLSVLLVAPPSPELYQQALRAGVRDLLSPDADDAEVKDVFQRAMEVGDRRRAAIAAEQAAPTGRTLVVLSPKGGSGKTTTATNLARTLATDAPGGVVLVDLDLQFGDDAGALGLVPEHTMADAAGAVGGIDALTLKVFLTPHPSGLYVLCAPPTPEAGEGISAEQVSRVLELLALEFPYVVVDTAAGLNEHALSAIEHATDLILVCSMDAPSVRALRKEVLALDQLGMTHQARHLVLNRADSRVGLDTSDVEATIGLRVAVALPSTRLIPTSVNLATAVVESDPRSPVARRFRSLSERFREPPDAAQPPAARPRWLRREAS